MNQSYLKIISCTLFALLAFAGNSVLCRLALGENMIDAASFTVIRLLSGIVILLLVILFKTKVSNNNNQSNTKGSWLATCMLFIYAIAFSFGYITLDTGIGALVLFGSVQITMLIVNLIKGNKLHYSEWLGLAISFYGFIYLILPTLTTPSLSGVILMVSSGIAWAFYTLLGRGSKDPLSDTAYNFLRTFPLLLIVLLLSFKNAHFTNQGIYLAVLSGALASGVGYTIWYIALGGLNVSQASVVQLCVPIIAAIGGVIFANELITQRLIISSVLVLGGILIVVLGRSYFVKISK